VLNNFSWHELVGRAGTESKFVAQRRGPAEQNVPEVQHLECHDMAEHDPEDGHDRGKGPPRPVGHQTDLADAFP
jgi:hypothetical protein